MTYLELTVDLIKDFEFKVLIIMDNECCIMDGGWWIKNQNTYQYLLIHTKIVVKKVTVRKPVS